MQVEKHALVGSLNFSLALKKIIDDNLKFLPLAKKYISIRYIPFNIEHTYQFISSLIFLLFP
jgi:hypothetical protein